MRGRIGSGKTYQSKLLCQLLGAEHLSVDAVMESRYGTECMGREAHVKAEAEVLDELLEKAVSICAEQGRMCVIDHGFWSIGELERAKEYIASKGIFCLVIETKASFNVRLARVGTRTDGKRFAKEKLVKLDGYYEETGKGSPNVFVIETVE